MKIKKSIILGFILVCFSLLVQAQKPTKTKYISRYDDSTIQQLGYYVNGLKDKTWYFYLSNGVIERKEKWIKGELQWQIYYNHRGKIIRTVDKNGKETFKNKCNCT